MILVDFNGILYQSIFRAISAVKAQKDASGMYKVSDFMPVALSGLLMDLFSLQQDFAVKKGGIVICLDNTHPYNWRRQYLGSYKHQRKEQMEVSPIPFGEVFEKTNEFIKQIKENTPWRVVSVPTAEADDVILCLAKQYAKKEPVMIFSSDKDMIQAQKHGDVVQFSPLTRKWVTPETKSDNMDEWLMEHVILGDEADDVPRITYRTEFSKAFKKYLETLKLKISVKEYNKLPQEKQMEIEDGFDVLTSKGVKDIWTQPKLGPATLRKLKQTGKLDEFLDSNPLYRENLERNKHLVLDEYIPAEILNNSILNYIESAKRDFDISAFKKYLAENGMGGLLLDLPPNFVSSTCLWD